jgi:hypothetical protein
MRLAVTTGAAGVTTIAPTITLNGHVYGTEITTVSLMSFTAIDNGGTAYSRVAFPVNETGNRRFLIAFKVRQDVLGVGAHVAASGNGAAFRIFTSTAGQWRGQILGGSYPTPRCGTTASANGVWQTHIWAINLDATVATQVSSWWINGIEQSQASGSGIDTSGALASIQTNSLFVGDLGLFAEADGGGVIFNGALEFFWMHWGDSSFVIPDLSDAAVRNKFTRELIGISDGAGPLGFAPKFFYPGDANLTDWNDNVTGVPNRGSLASRPALRQAGTYT